MELPPNDPRAAVLSSALPPPPPPPIPEVDDWPVTREDLAAFKSTLAEITPAPGASAWDLILDKEIPHSIRYTAWRRTNAAGQTEYKSVTVVPDVSVEEFSDLYLDDDFRPQWDPMIAEHTVIASGDFFQRQQIVRWVRRFPFKFITPR
eukprot:CAMPEP_0175046940 /NCGR_PEP_ID=MMETSP0052_2-20121109/5312_1 /TAXON_ID=51329 ORGANISM="Polytomella parva, Strain SAG 63-3" /NCGR_SAMPLE_ID=MMETSP0052_2 /ASSEMBLY_ACC=CAM_ASM_000194 /LENGTH=148 /DNA_ID=CAMNT_0016310747 /DNA_START=356 /DNA_END=798 /DNA_ORIENTATION=+